MNGRVEPSPLRIVLAVLLAVLLAFSAWRVVSLSIAKAEIKTESGQSQAQVLAGIHAAPLEGIGYRDLAKLAETRGDETTAAADYELAAKRAPRDLPTLGWLVNRDLRLRNFPAALAHMDQTLRVQPETEPQIFPVLMTFATEPRVQAMLADALERQPPWRLNFLQQLMSKIPDSAQMFGLMEQLRHAPDGLSEPELASWLERLTQDHHWSTAYLTWVASLEPAARQHIGNVYNGSFERDPSQLGFDWQFGQVSGASISRDRTEGSDGALALRIAFEDRRVPFKHVRQLLALTPGDYRLNGRVRLEDLRSERGLIWTLSCVETGRPLAETEPMSGNHGWRDFVTEFTITEQNCGGQWLTLRLPARIPAEQRIGGVAWFDDLRITSVYAAKK